MIIFLSLFLCMLSKKHKLQEQKMKSTTTIVYRVQYSVPYECRRIQLRIDD